MNKLYFLFLFVSILLACGKSDNMNPFGPNPTKPTTPTPVVRAASLGIVGDTTDVKTTTKGGVVIMGGSTDVDAAFKWMIERSGGGDVVIIRATGTNAYNAYVNELGKVQSVETLLINSRALANNASVAHTIRNAEMLFIAGGDQADYVTFWKGTKVMEAINYLLTEKKVPVGGTSAGAAILGNYYFAAINGGIDSQEALDNPFNQRITIEKDDFLKTPYLSNVITDQHFSQRNREGRIGVFLARIMKDWSKVPYGIAVDEKTAVCIDELGIATTVGTNKAFFLKTDAVNKPEIFSSGSKVTWNNSGKAIQVTSIAGTVPNNKFDLKTFATASTDGWNRGYWSLVAGNFIGIPL